MLKKHPDRHWGVYLALLTFYRPEFSGCKIMTCLNALKGKGDGQAARADIIRHTLKVLGWSWSDFCDFILCGINSFYIWSLPLLVMINDNASTMWKERGEKELICQDFFHWKWWLSLYFFFVFPFYSWDERIIFK